VVKLLLALPGIDYNHETNEVEIVLMCIMSTHSFNMLEVVNMTSANPCCVVFQSQGDTALIVASHRGHVEVVKLLLALHGIDYNHKTDEVKIVLMYRMMLTHSFNMLEVHSI
jgi:hypothetical protein